jgi:hypothetical protein
MGSMRQWEPPSLERLHMLQQNCQYGFRPVKSAQNGPLEFEGPSRARSSGSQCLAVSDLCLAYLRGGCLSIYLKGLKKILPGVE